MSKEREIFGNAIEITDLVERESYINEACNGDEELRRSIVELLELEKEDSSFLSEEQLSVSPPVTTSAGSLIGRYKLLEEIGEGGCGIVYMAEQLEPVRRKVAFKIVKPGMDTRQVIARFEAERQALALMDHPNIAGVLDGGETEYGRPYFVMELVDGVSITEFCDANRMMPRERLSLFIKVCHAIQHAHQKGLIHRDIKPTNILVTLHGGEAVPRVIDFGIAKALGQDLTERTLFTRHGQVVGTLQYMSPEQAERSDLDIDTRSDIYSLGVLLYELLTGGTPLERRRLKQAALDEGLRMVREEEPPTPSTRISKLGDRGTIISQQRGTELPRLGKLVRGDLDWIVMRALEKDRSRRFESVGELVADIERHLADKPVVSGPPSAMYRVAKFIRRNRIGVFSATVVAASLVLGMTFAVVGLVRANAERTKADAERAKAIESADEAQAMLTVVRYMVQANPDAGRGREFSLEEMLNEFSNGLLAIENGQLNVEALPKLWMRNYKDPNRDVFLASFPDLSDQPTIAAEIHAILGVNYDQLELYEKALIHFGREYELCRQVYGEKHPRVAWAAHEIATTYRHRSNNWYAKPADKKRDIVTALKHAEVAISTFDELGSYSQSSLIPRGIYGELLTKTGELDRAELVLRRTMEEVEKRAQDLPDPKGALLFLRRTLVANLVEQGKTKKSISEGRISLKEGLEYNPGPGREAESNRAWAYIQFGDVFRGAGMPAEASQQYQKAMELVEHHGPECFWYFLATGKYAVEQAKERHFQAAIEAWERLLGYDHHRDVIDVYNHLVLLELNRNQYAAAEQRCDDLLKKAGDAPANSDLRTVAKFMMAFCQFRRDADDCHALCDEALREAQILAEEHFDAFSLSYSWLLLRQSEPTPNHVEHAIEHTRKALETLRHDYLIALAHYNLSLAYSMSSWSEENSKLAVQNAKLALQKLPEHELFLRQEFELHMDELSESEDQKDVQIR